MFSHFVLKIDVNYVFRHIQVSDARLWKGIAKVLPSCLRDFIILTDVQTPNLLSF